MQFYYKHGFNGTNAAKLTFEDGSYLSVVQGPGTYSTLGTSVETWDLADNTQPEGWVSVEELCEKLLAKKLTPAEVREVLEKLDLKTRHPLSNNNGGN